MKRLRSALALITCGIVLAGAAAIIAGLHLATARNDAIHADRQLRSCRGLIGEIARLESEPTAIRRQVIARTDLAQRIERAAAAAGINTAEQLIRIDPRPRPRLQQRSAEAGDSMAAEYLEESTDIVLDRVALPQLVRFLFEVRGDHTDRLHLSRLRLQTPHDDLLGEQWMAELTLTYIVLALPDGPEGPESGASEATSESEPL